MSAGQINSGALFRFQEKPAMLSSIAASGFVLEQSAALNGPWSSVTNFLVISNNQHVVTVPVSGSSQFFRLRK